MRFDYLLMGLKKEGWGFCAAYVSLEGTRRILGGLENKGVTDD